MSLCRRVPGLKDRHSVRGSAPSGVRARRIVPDSTRRGNPRVSRVFYADEGAQGSFGEGHV